MGIPENLNLVKAEIAAAAVAAGRPANAVLLIAVTKTKPIGDVRLAMTTGQLDFGENKVQELVEKHAALPEARWHMIGALQRNKVRQIIPFIHLIHSVDSERLLAEIYRQAGLHNRQVDCLLQINISDEDQKGGLTEGEAEEILQQITNYPNVHIKGVMGIGEFTDDATVISAQFKRLAAARSRFEAFVGPQIVMQDLSMGMSGDFESAIQAGSTRVRVGSSIFGGR
jgi:pyridoxal phosphate enzyme (YggS family)